MSSPERMPQRAETEPNLSYADYLPHAWEQQKAIERLEEAKDPELWGQIAHLRDSWNKHHQTALLTMAPAILSKEEADKINIFRQITQQRRAPLAGEKTNYEAGETAYKNLESIIERVRFTQSIPAEFMGRFFPEQISKKIRQDLERTDSLLTTNSAAA